MDGAGHRISIPGYSDFVEVGRGGFAIVYRAQQEVFQREVAVKMITVLDVDDDARRRFQRECTAIGGLAWHPHIVTVFDAGDTPAGSPYLVMEYLPAGSLGDRMRRDGSVPWPEVVAIGAKIGGALQAAHDAGTLHRDIKPDNVLINRVGEPTLADFGIVTLQDGTRSRSGFLIATVAYAPPEVIAGERATVASDVYSLGAMLHALLAGSAPFTRPTDESMFALMRRIGNEPPPDLRPLGVPDRVAGAIEQCMAKLPQDRPPSAAAVGELLTDHADVPSTGHPIGVAIVPPYSITQVAAASAPIDEPVKGNSHPASIALSTPPAAAPPVGHAASRALGGRRVLFAAAVIAMVAGAVAAALIGDDEAPDENTAAGSAVSDDDFGDQFPDPEEGQALTVLGTGTSGDSGDGDAPVTLLDNPWTLLVDDSGLLKLVDTGRDRVRVVQDAFVTTVLGPPADGDLAAPRGLSVGAGGIHIADTDHSAIVRFESDGVSTVVAGQISSEGYSGDDGPATAAQLDNPHGLAEGPDGALFIADSNNNAIRRVGPDGIITTVAGAGSEGFSGDGGAAVDAEFDAPLAVAFDRQGRLLIADTDNNVIRLVALDGVVTTIAGTGEAGFAGDDGPAEQALLHAPSALVVAEDGTLYVADSLNMRIRRIDVDGTITTVVGNGEQGFVDSGPALEMPLDQPRGIDLGPDGDLFIADTGNSRVVRVDSSAL